MNRMPQVAVALFFALSAPAHAAFTVTPSTYQAGAHAQIVIHSDFATTPKRVALHFPPGLVGNPNAADKCPVQTFENGLCGLAVPNSQVGTATANGLIGGTVYNLVPQAG